jgi:hypothetical protein
MNHATPIIHSPSLAPLADAYMRIELIEWLRASGITLIDLLSSYAIARRGTRAKAADLLEEMGFFSMPWEKSFASWLIEYPSPERHPASMEFEYIELLGRILHAHHHNENKKA